MLTTSSSNLVTVNTVSAARREWDWQVRHFSRVQHKLYDTFCIILDAESFNWKRLHNKIHSGVWSAIHSWIWNAMNRSFAKNGSRCVHRIWQPPHYPEMFVLHGAVSNHTDGCDCKEDRNQNSTSFAPAALYCKTLVVSFMFTPFCGQLRFFTFQCVDLAIHTTQWWVRHLDFLKASGEPEHLSFTYESVLLRLRTFTC